MAEKTDDTTLGWPDESITALKDFFEQGSIGLHLVGADGQILRANQADLDLLGYLRKLLVVGATWAIRRARSGAVAAGS